MTYDRKTEPRMDYRGSLKTLHPILLVRMVGKLVEIDRMTPICLHYCLLMHSQHPARITLDVRNESISNFDFGEILEPVTSDSTK